ncbi:MAG: hypothetical protein Q4E75_05115 [bacterium]|nr:hypothetical protein [bacterium]
MKNILNKLIEFFKTKIFRKSKRKTQKDEPKIIKRKIDSVQIGDIIWAKRYSNSREKAKIPEGHLEGPFIVIDKSKDKLMCLQGSSVEPDSKVEEFKYFISNRKHSLLKNTYFTCDKIKFVDDDSFISILSYLEKGELEELTKKIKTLNNDYNIKNKARLKFQIGDILKIDDNIYLILDLNEEKIECVKLDQKFEDLSNHTPVNLSKVDYSKKYTFPANQKAHFIAALPNDLIKYTLRLLKEYIESLKTKDIPKRGSIILFENCKYYVYGEESDNLLTIKLIDNGVAKFRINGEVYFTNFDEFIINRKDNIIKICDAKDDEIEYIKNLKKSYKKSQDKNSNNNTIKVGSIVENYYGDAFIVVEIHPKTYECFNINDLLDNIYNPLLISKKNLKLSKKTVKYDLNWLKDNPTFKKNYDVDISNLGESSINKGCLIKKDNRLYYIYSEDETSWLAHSVFNTNFNDFQKVFIKSKIYYINFEDSISLSKDNDYNVVATLTKKEYDFIKYKKKQFNTEITGNNIKR